MANPVGRQSFADIYPARSALAVVKGGRERMGQRVYAPLEDGRIIRAEICDSVFYDPEGARQNV